MISKAIYEHRSNLILEDSLDSKAWGDKSDLAIWKAFKHGDRSALIHIYTQYFPLLFDYAHQFIKDRESVKDHIQDLFIYLYKHRQGISETDSIKYYLFKCLRRRIKSDNDRILAHRDHQPERGCGAEDSSEVRMIENEALLHKQRVLNEAIKTLPQKQQEIIYHYYYLGFSYKEIASIMNFSQVKSARKLLYRAVNGLRSKVDMSIFTILLIICISI